jgi:hypothetical protein
MQKGMNRWLRSSRTKHRTLGRRPKGATSEQTTMIIGIPR